MRRSGRMMRVRLPALYRFIYLGMFAVGGAFFGVTALADAAAGKGDSWVAGGCALATVCMTLAYRTLNIGIVVCADEVRAEGLIHGWAVDRTSVASVVEDRRWLGQTGLSLQFDDGALRRRPYTLASLNQSDTECLRRRIELALAEGNTP